MRVELEIERTDAGAPAPYWQTFRVEVPPRVTVLDTLIAIKDEVDGSVTFRRSCRSAICGSCAMRINGRSGLACDTLVADELKRFGRVRVQPLANMPVLRDLAVDMQPFWKRVDAVTPWVDRGDDAPTEWPVTAETRMPQSAVEALDDASRCIMCMACFSACEIAEVDDKFLGPAALAKAFRMVADPRDTKTRERLQDLAETGGYWDCTRCNQCVEACPKDVKPMEAIIALRREGIRAGLPATPGSRHITEFVGIVRTEGRLNEGRMPLKMKLPQPLELLKMAPLALRMLKKGKMPMPVHLPIPGVKDVRGIMDATVGKSGHIHPPADTAPDTPPPTPDPPRNTPSDSSAAPAAPPKDAP